MSLNDLLFIAYTACVSIAVILVVAVYWGLR